MYNGRSPDLRVVCGVKTGNSGYLLSDAPVVVMEQYILVLQYVQGAIVIVFVECTAAVVCNMQTDLVKTADILFSTSGIEF
jgi:hypothetical protein